MSSQFKSIKYDVLMKRCKQLLCCYGINDIDAGKIIKNLLEADVGGVRTHGISTLPSHIRKLKNKEYNIAPHFTITKENYSFSVIDADNAIGMLSADFCMELAISNALEKGFHIVWCHNANTYSAAFVYAKKALNKGCIGITFCNTPPQMAPWNGKIKLLGSNPFSIAIPTKSANPIIFDMSTSVVAKSKINLAKCENTNIPFGWALDKDGNDTTNPYEAVEGSLLPIAGYKGYGLAMTIDILAGVLSGASYLDGVEKFIHNPDKGSMNVGQSFIVINPKLISGDIFYARMDEYINIIKKSPSKSGEETIHLPGENKYKKTRTQISISNITYNDINQLLSEHNLEPI